jgi:hypothetical protein
MMMCDLHNAWELAMNFADDARCGESESLLEVEHVDHEGDDLARRNFTVAQTGTNSGGVPLTASTVE